MASDLLHQRAFRPGGNCHLASVQPHVAPLDSFRGQCPQRSEVLCQANGNDDFRQLVRRRQPHQTQTGAGRRMDARGPADRADGHRHFEGTLQRAVCPDRPAAERSIPAGAGRIRMGSGLDGSPVVAGGDDDRVDPVHDSFVVGRRPVGIGGGEGPGFHDPGADALSGEVAEGQRVRRNPAARPARRRSAKLKGCAGAPVRR
jgi:hypothetical protein